ncbi:MAG: AMP-binding protein [Deltaproteobacteria bacterium]|nr:AMP-binding protein [Deltaproteobacteria bacterium]
MKVNVASWVEKHARVYRDKPALLSDRYDVTWAALDRRVARLAAAFRACGVTRGRRVAALLFNVCEQVEVVLACARVGAIAVPMNFRLTPAELAYQLGDCTPDVLVHDVDLEEVVAAALSLAGSAGDLMRVRVPRDREAVQGGYEELLAGSDPAAGAIDPEAGGGDPLFIMYTAGTTGASKGVVLSHDNVFWQTVNGWALGIDPRATGLVLLPLFHTGGMNGSVLPLVHVGAATVLLKRFDPAEVLRAVERHRVSGMVGVPVQFQMIAECAAFDSTDFSSVAALISGGGPLADSLRDRYFARGLRFTQGYGLTEAAPGVTGQTPDEFARKPGSVGRQCLYVEVRIVAPDGRECGVGEEGEVVVSGPNVMLGYWNRPDETAQVLRDGRLYTGDLGRLDEDGYLYLTGRKKDLIISGGENVHPAEVENAILSHPGVAEAAVLGLPDPRWTEVPAAAVVRRDPGLTAEALLGFLAARLAKYKMPRKVVFVDSLPRNAAGKVLKNRVRDRFAAEGSV